LVVKNFKKYISKNYQGGKKAMTDKKIVCKDCGQDFLFTVGEQEFYKEKGLTSDPVRCPKCRRARKAQRQQRH